MNKDLNNELEDLVSNDMAYTFSRNMLMSDENGKNMVEIAQRYGLSEKQSVLMVMELASLQQSGGK